MAFKFFAIPTHGTAGFESELNGFLRGHQVLSVDRRFVEHGALSFWSLCVDYLDAEEAAAGSSRPPGTRGKVDYKEVLVPEEFALFSRLRDVRKQIAQTAAVPVYTIFSNEQLAQMVKQKAATTADLERIAGIGDARVQKYGERVIEVLVAEWSRHAPDGQPV